MKLIHYFVVVLLSSISAVTLRADPPKVVLTSPAFWAMNVDSAKQKHISVTFDQPMRAGFSSWLGRSSIAPDSKSPATLSKDLKTFNLAVPLERAKVYVFGLNENGTPGVGFQNEKGVTARPYFLVFRTAGKLQAEDTPPALVKSKPGNGAKEIDPAGTEGIILEFDKEMRHDKHGLHLFEGDTAVDVSKTKFIYSEDGLTFTLSCDLKPLQAYRVELNNVNDIGFASKGKLPLWPVTIAFTTGPAK